MTSSGRATPPRPGRTSPRYGVTKPFVLFVSSLWPYKNCDGLLRAWALARRRARGRQLAIVGPGRDEKYVAALHALAAELGISGRRRLRRRGAARGDRPLLPGGGRLRLPVAQRDLRAAHPRGHGLRLPGRDLGRQRHAGDRGRRRGPVRPGRPGVHRPGHRRGGRAGAGPPARRGTATGRPVHLGGDGRSDPRCLPRGRRATDGTGRNEDPRHRRCRVHRVAHLRPAARARATTSWSSTR